MFKLFSASTTLLASKIEFNPNPSEGEHYLFIEGDKVGFIAWLLKLLGLSDPSVKVIVDDKLIKRIDGGKKYTVSPTSSIYGFSSGYSNNKLYLVLMILMVCLALFFLVISARPILVILIVLAALGGLFYWLYKRSGALEMSIQCYKDGHGANLRVKSGLTGKKLDKSDFENIFNSINNASQANSQFYK
ncbi:hypothetical protein N9E11_02660 [Crocinitomicaceae bacterium]|nr:hypothetical protein [Crocinitomicaceae bacterium]